MSVGVSAGYAQQGFGTEGRVCQVVIQANEYACHGVQVLGTEHMTRHLECVGLLACREGKRIVTHRVVLVVVADGIAEVDGIRHIGF